MSEPTYLAFESLVCSQPTPNPSFLHPRLSARLREMSDDLLQLEKDPEDTKKSRKAGFIEVPTSVFVQRVDIGGQPLPPISFYLFPQGHETPTQIRKGSEPYSLLALSAYSKIWIEEADLPRVRGLAETILTNPKDLEALPLEKRIEALQNAAAVVVEDIFHSPTPENITRSVKVVSAFVRTLVQDPKAFFMLTKLSNHDSYTLQHSIGAAVNSIILAKKVGVPEGPDLLEVGLAGLLHDIGKVKVKTEIINKPGPLDEAEWKEMRQHSLLGYDLVKDHPLLTERTKAAILEHHEDHDGNGYPYKKKPEEIHLFSKIIGICDVFNALTTNRSYSNARSPFDAFQLMREKMPNKFDPKLFKELILIYGGKT